MTFVIGGTTKNMYIENKNVQEHAYTFQNPLTTNTQPVQNQCDTNSKAVENQFKTHSKPIQNPFKQIPYLLQTHSKPI
jgi:hypothetical protein